MGCRVRRDGMRSSSRRDAQFVAMNSKQRRTLTAERPGGGSGKCGNQASLTLLLSPFTTLAAPKIGGGSGKVEIKRACFPFPLAFHYL